MEENEWISLYYEENEKAEKLEQENKQLKERIAVLEALLEEQLKKEFPAKALKEKGVCLQSELNEAIETIRDFMDWYVETDISAEALPPELRQKAAAFLRR